MNPRSARAAPPAAPFVVAVAASAGGLNALTELLAALPAGLGAAILVVLHLPPDHPSYLVDVLARRTRLSVKGAEEGELLRVGTVYCALPDLHLLVRAGGTVTLTHTARTQYVRPSADELFASAASVYGPRALALVLSGTGRDGAEGVRALKEAGGRVVAQSEESAEHFGMPEAAIRTGAVDAVLALGEMSAAVEAFVTPPEKAAPEKIASEKIASEKVAARTSGASGEGGDA